MTLPRFLNGLAVVLLIGVASTLLLRADDAAKPKSEDTQVYELRTYTSVPGRLPALNARFRDHTMKLFEKHGMKNIAYWTPIDKPNTLVYVISHKSREAAEKSWKAFIDDPEWNKAKTESEKDGKIVEKVEREYLTPTDYSPMK
jgi:hypothetical protein